MGSAEEKNSQSGEGRTSALAAQLAGARFTVCVPLLIANPTLAVEIAGPSSYLFAIIAGALAIAATLWGVLAHRRAVSLRKLWRTSSAKARCLLSERDAWLSAERESLLVWSPEPAKRLSFAGARELLEECLAGQDAPVLAAALDGLSNQGIPFACTCRTLSRIIAVRGRPAGGHLLVFLEAQAHEEQTLDFRGALDAIPTPAWIRGKNLALEFANRAFLAATGMSEEAVRTANVAFDRSERELAAAAQTGSEIIEAKRFAVLSGSRRALALTLAPLSDGSVLGAALDVTGITETEARLRQHIEAHADILDRLETAVAFFGGDRKLSFYNRACIDLSSLPEAWLQTHPSHGEFLDRLRELRRLPEQTDFRAWKQQQARLFEQRESPGEEIWHLPLGQTWRVAAQPHPLGGLVFMFEDVSEQLMLESSYNTLIKVQRATLDTLQEGVAVFGPDGRLKLRNAAFARIWRLDPAELSGEPHLKNVAEACATRFGGDRIWDLVTASVTSAVSERNREWSEIERSDGAIISLTIAPLPDGATLVSFSDITDRFRIETALRERNDALEASDRIKSEFVKRISYELRTPLNSIMGFAEMLKAGTAGPLNARQSDYTDAVLKASNALRDLVNDVLDLSEIESGTMELDFENLDLYVLLFGMAEHARGWAAKIGLTFRFECNEAQGSFVADARRLKQVVFNLIANAFKYTPRGGLVTLGGRISGDEVRIFVADTGPGISADIMPSAFDRFSAKGGAVARAGAGLGLTLVNQFIELHGGWVELESRSGGGTRVTCHIPRRFERRKQKSQDAKARA